jgi:CxxC-x17-CxxC domain-containing protein
MALRRLMNFQDRPLQCLDCKNEFIFTAGEQEFYERKGFRELPKRCRPCREARKSRRVDSDGMGNDSGYSGNYAVDGNRTPRSSRELFDATCASCGAPARVPFRPANGRPVYCRDCYGSRQGQGSGYGGGY